MNEFLPIPGYEGIYAINAAGDVLALEKLVRMPAGGVRCWPQAMLKKHHMRTGYVMVTLSKEGKRASFSVHRLVCLVFIGKPDQPGLEVNHKDGDKKNNKRSNLEWVTKSENILHARRILKTHQSLHRAVEGLDPATGLVVAKFRSLTESQTDGFSPTNVSACIHGRLKTSGGLTWRMAL